MRGFPAVSSTRGKPMSHVRRQCFIPPHVADRLAVEIGHPAMFEAGLRAERAALLAQGVQPVAPDIVQVFDSGHHQRTTGPLLAQPYNDQRAQEALDGLMATVATHELLGVTFSAGGLKAYGHYGEDYDNAFWDGSEMVFGDGDGALFQAFTRDKGVIAHELGHGVTAELLAYLRMAGALNESVSDAWNALVVQHAGGLTPYDELSWLVGPKATLFLPAFTGRALRDMLNPGTAYRNDPMLGDDPQPDHMDHYVETDQDDGGVHINSGVPNRAFALASRGAGNTMEMMGVWLRGLNTVGNPNCDFATFARSTVNAAGSYADVVHGAWVTVGVLEASVPEPPPAPAPAPSGSPD